jgi:hypothetical protein
MTRGGLLYYPMGFSSTRTGSFSQTKTSFRVSKTPFYIMALGTAFEYAINVLTAYTVSIKKRCSKSADGLYDSHHLFQRRLIRITSDQQLWGL